MEEPTLVLGGLWKQPRRREPRCSAPPRLEAAEQEARRPAASSPTSSLMCLGSVADSGAVTTLCLLYSLAPWLLRRPCVGLSPRSSCPTVSCSVSAPSLALGASGGLPKWSPLRGLICPLRVVAQLCPPDFQTCLSPASWKSLPCCSAGPTGVVSPNPDWFPFFGKRVCLLIIYPGRLLLLHLLSCDCVWFVSPCPSRPVTEAD